MPLKNNYNETESNLSKKTTASTQSGFSLIELMIVVVIIGIIAAIAIPNLLASQRAANEASAVNSLRTIFSGQIAYQRSVGGGSFGTLADLGNAIIIDEVLTTAPNIKSRYQFQVVPLAATPALEPGFDAIAIPQGHILSQPVTAAGTRDFGVTEAGVIYRTNDDTRIAFARATRQPTSPSAEPF